MRCSRTNLAEHYHDPKCDVRLCSDCLLYSMQVTTDKERPVMLACQKGHALSYLKEEDIEEVCCQCQKTKYIKLLCIHCE